MELIKLAVSDAVETLLMSQSTIYNWIEKDKLKLDPESSEKIIIISQEEIDKIRERNLSSKRNKISKKLHESSDNDYNNIQENPIIDVEISNNSQESYEPFQENTNTNQMELVKFISELSAKAGKYELLEDNSRQSKEDVKYWQEKYFELQNDYNKLQNKFDNLQEALENEKKRPFWKRNVL